MRLIMLFQSTRSAIGAERLLRTSKIEYTVVPVPRDISSNCGMAILVSESQKDSVTQLLETEHLHCLWHNDCLFKE